MRSPHGETTSPAVEGIPEAERKPREAIFALNDVMVSYNGKPAVRGVSFDIGKNEITALIGPSGCGKSTLIRCFNRMNDLITGATVDGEVLYHGQNLYAPRSTPSRCASASAWSSRSRTRSPSRSTTTSRSDRGCSG